MALVVLAGSAVAASAEDIHPISLVCKHDFCAGIVRNGAGRIDFRIGSFTFRGAYSLCVTDPTGRQLCHRYPLNPSCNCSIKDWRHNFPDKQDGRYRVKWRHAGKQLGRTQSFRQPQQTGRARSAGQ
jgi:hypothetical protein